MGSVLVTRAPSADVAELDAARAAFRRACGREEEIRRGDADAELGIEGAGDVLEAAQADRDGLMRALARGESVGADAMAAARKAIQDAHARIGEAEGALASRAELLEFAEAETKAARERLEAGLKAAIRAEDARLAARQRDLEAERDRAAAEAGKLGGIRTSAGQTLRGSMGTRPTVRDFESVLAIMRAEPPS